VPRSGSSLIKSVLPKAAPLQPPTCPSRIWFPETDWGIVLTHPSGIAYAEPALVLIRLSPMPKHGPEGRYLYRLEKRAFTVIIDVPWLKRGGSSSPATGVRANVLGGPSTLFTPVCWTQAT
jgi:hypothetical protein